MKVAFRCDASAEIGGGHVMRCLALADALRERGALTKFLCRDEPGNLGKQIEARGHSLSWLSPGGTLAEDARASLDILEKGSPWDWLVVDHYVLGADWEKRMRVSAKKIMAIDDYATRSHDCDLLLDQNYHDDAEQCYSRKLPEQCDRLFGTRYALLQPIYAKLRAGLAPRTGRIQRVLVYFGWADHAGLSRMALDAFLLLKRFDIELDIVVNEASPQFSGIQLVAKERKNIRVHGSLPSLAPLMAACDIAIGAGGSTIWECCCLGVPSVVITLANNQIPVASALARHGMIHYLGHRGEVDQAQLANTLMTLFTKDLPQRQSQACWQLVDGLGTGRVCAIMKPSQRNVINIRPARSDDENLLLQWANDPLVRKNAFRTDMIRPDDHHAWFQKRINDASSCRIYVAEIENRIPAGQVRFERGPEGWEVSYSLDAAFRGIGLAVPMVKAAMRELALVTTDHNVIGRVKENNLLSRRVFERLGFHPSERGSDGIVIFRLSIDDVDVNNGVAA